VLTNTFGPFRTTYFLLPSILFAIPGNHVVQILGFSLCRLLQTQTYSTLNYWVFGLFPSSGILENRKHEVSETGSVSDLR
jgi:hypothetical protein